MAQVTGRIAFVQQDIKNMLARMAAEINQACANQPLCLVGIRTGGAHLAARLAALLGQLRRQPIACGALDINLYRDDWSMRHHAPLLQSTEIDFDLHNQHVLLVDDVLYTGRTVRAALDALLDMGRPRRIELAVLIDRGGRELPIAPNYVGAALHIAQGGRVDVVLAEQGKEDKVEISEKG